MRGFFYDPRPAALRNIAWTFAAMTILLLGVVTYTALSSTVITVKLGKVPKEVNFRLALVGDSSRPGSAGGLKVLFLETTDTTEDVFIPTGSTVLAGKAGGVVTLHNDTARAQPLVATTRLLSTGGILFRIKEAVNVP